MVNKNKQTGQTDNSSFRSENCVPTQKGDVFPAPESKFFWSGTNHLRDGSRCPNNAVEMEGGSLFVQSMFSFFHSKPKMIVVSRPVHPHCRLKPLLSLSVSLYAETPCTRRATLGCVTSTSRFCLYSLRLFILLNTGANLTPHPPHHTNEGGNIG